MGYTHYWRLGPFIEEKSYKKALTECRKIIKASPVPLGNAYGDGKPKLNNGVWINGVGEDGHETFALGSIPIRESGGSDPGFNFCKTARKPYDLIVVACLLVLHDRLGESVGVSSDGEPHEWEAGREFASKVLKREIKIPQHIVDQTGMYGWAARNYREKHPEYEYTPLDKSHPNHHKENIPDYAKN